MRALERRVKRLERELAEAQTAHERRLELVRRAANRRLAAMMKEIATLRHHEARAEMLERRLVAHPEEDAAVALRLGRHPTDALVAEGTPDGEDPRLPG